jgi:hypothetical protein
LRLRAKLPPHSVFGGFAFFDDDGAAAAAVRFVIRLRGFMASLIMN